MSNILADDMKNHLNLSKMVEIAKNDNIVFKTLAEPILDGQLAIQSDWSDFNGILALAAMCFSATTTVLLIWMFYKVKKMSAALFFLQQSRHIKALPSTLPSFLYTHKSESGATSSFDFDITLSWEHANFIFLCLNTILLLVIVLRFIKFRKAPRLLIEITSMEQCIFLPIMKLPLCPSHSKINVPSIISELNICGSWLSPKLKINWEEFSIKNELTEEMYMVPTKLPLNLWQKYKLAKILKSPFFIHLHTEHSGYLSPISLSTM